MGAMRSSAALLLVALVACGGPSPTTPSSSAKHQAGGNKADPDVVAAANMARKFWGALIAHDDHGIDEAIAFPFMWDERCRIFRSRAEMNAHLSTVEQPPDVRIGDVHPLSPSDVPDELKEAIEDLSATDGCTAEIGPLQAEAARMERSFVVVDMFVAGQKIPTVTRLSRSTGIAITSWRVTGIDN